MSSLLLLKILIGFGITAAVIFFVFSVVGVMQDVPKEERTYMDPLPKSLRWIWWLVKIFAFYVGDRLPVDTLEKYKLTLQRSGMNFIMTPDQYVGLRLTSMLICTLFILLFFLLLGGFDWMWLFFAAVLGYFLPTISLVDMKKKRNKKLVRALPIYLDYLTMAVQAGMNLNGAITQAVAKGPDGPLRVEFEKVLRDIRAGMARNDAIRNLAARNDLPEITAFTTSIIQAERTGASIGDTLKIQADQRRVERFQRAEKLAMEAPVKLIFPLVFFIFPMTFMVILFPLIMRYIHNI